MFSTPTEDSRHAALTAAILRVLVAHHPDLHDEIKRLADQYEQDVCYPNSEILSARRTFARDFDEELT